MSVIFLALPVILFITFVIALVLFIVAKVSDKKTPGSFTRGQITGRKIFMIVSGSIFGVIFTAVVAVDILMTIAVNHM